MLMENFKGLLGGEIQITRIENILPRPSKPVTVKAVIAGSVRDPAPSDTKLISHATLGGKYDLDMPKIHCQIP